MKTLLKDVATRTLWGGKEEKTRGRVKKTYLNGWWHEGIEGGGGFLGGGGVWVGASCPHTHICTLYKKAF
jgi:hypothetical protein